MQIDYAEVKMEIGEIKKEFIKFILVLDEATVKINELLQEPADIRDKGRGKYPFA